MAGSGTPNITSMLRTGIVILRQQPATPGVAPTFNLAFKPFRGVQFYALYAEGYRMPSLFEARGAQSGPDAQSLKPEHQKNYEFGMNVLRDGILTEHDKARLKIAYFNNTTDNFISKLIELGSDLPNFENIHSAKFSGIEVSGTYDIGPFFTTAGLNWYEHVAFCHSLGQCGGTDPSPADDADLSNNYVPPHLAATGTLGTHLLHGKLTDGARISFTGNRAPCSRRSGESQPIRGRLGHHSQLGSLHAHRCLCELQDHQSRLARRDW